MSIDREKLKDVTVSTRTGWIPLGGSECCLAIRSMHESFSVRSHRRVHHGPNDSVTPENPTKYQLSKSHVSVSPSGTFIAIAPNEDSLATGAFLPLDTRLCVYGAKNTAQKKARKVRPSLFPVSTISWEREPASVKAIGWVTSSDDPEVLVVVLDDGSVHCFVARLGCHVRSKNAKLHLGNDVAEQGIDSCLISGDAVAVLSKNNGCFTVVKNIVDAPVFFKFPEYQGMLRCVSWDLISSSEDSTPGVISSDCLKIYVHGCEKFPISVV
jgi:hypothetical protein